MGDIAGLFKMLTLDLMFAGTCTHLPSPQLETPPNSNDGCFLSFFLSFLIEELETSKEPEPH